MSSGTMTRHKVPALGDKLAVVIGVSAVVPCGVTAHRGSRLEAELLRPLLLRKSSKWSRQSQQVAQKWQEPGACLRLPWGVAVGSWVESELLFEWIGREEPGFPAPSTLLSLRRLMATGQTHADISHSALDPKCKWMLYNPVTPGSFS